MGKHPSTRRYTPEFKKDAVALWRNSGRSMAEVARELGMSDVTLGTWVREADKSTPMTETEKSEREEATQLRKEIKALKEEIDILKRFTAYWVRDSSR